MLTKYPNKILFTPSEEVDFLEGRKIVKLLEKSIKEDCTWGTVAGLAAPQIGINKKVFIALGVPYINPTITWTSESSAMFREGCYSLEKDKYYDVRRSLSVRMEWVNRKGKKKSGTFHGFTAEVLQHEYDHLLGKLCSGDTK